jgi:hypothetical protein
MIRQFTKYGYSTVNQAMGITASYSGIPISKYTANKKSTFVPDDCHLESIEMELQNISAGDTITIFLTRDSTGLLPLTSDQLSGATQTVTLGYGSTTTGGVSFTINKDYHFDTTSANCISGELWLFAKANDACSATQIRLNWRA